MVGEVSWILGFTEQARVTEQAEFLDSHAKPEVVYGGFLWSDLDPERLVERFHQRLLLDFQVGWTAVGMASRGPCRLGPWSAPTSARAHRSAPYGLYLLSGARLRQSVETETGIPLSVKVHDRQRRLGPIFCDPGLEVTYDSKRDFRYQPPSIWSRLGGVGRYLAKGMGA